MLMGVRNHLLLRCSRVPGELLGLLWHHVMRGQPGGYVLVAGLDVRLVARLDVRLARRRQLRRGKHLRVHVVRRHGAGHHLRVLLG